jgi:hypothetical protein
VSKTERALTSSETGDALDDLFDDDAFDTAFDEAIEEADRELDIDGRSDDSDAADDESVDDVVDEEVVDEVDQVDQVDADEVVDHDDAIETEHAGIGEAELDDVPESDPETVVAEESSDDDIEDPSTAELPAPSARPDVETEDEDDDALPTIVQAIPDDDDLAARTTPVGDPELDEDNDGIDESDDDVSDQILEELRRAEIDGPVVAFAPQDDTTAARRRPKQAADYDPAPVPIPAKVPRVLGRKARVRKVTRVVRHVDPWSVFKIALVANFVLYIIVLTASVLLWNVAYATGTVDNIERFFESFGWNSFEFNGGELYHAGWIAGLFVVIGLTGLAVLGATLFNLITDLVGGMRFTVLEEEVVETRTSPMRRFVVRRTEPEVPAVIRDSSGAMVREAVVDDTGANARPSR